jgi:phage shock protein PspC (stress-responsive transcriptional regulator)
MVGGQGSDERHGGTSIKCKREPTQHGETLPRKSRLSRRFFKMGRTPALNTKKPCAAAERLQGDAADRPCLRFMRRSLQFVAARLLQRLAVARLQPSPPRRTAMGLADDLERLSALHRSGALSDVEFARAKGRVLGDGSSHDGTDAIGRWMRALRRSRSDRWLGGVCGGLAPMSGLPTWLWRLIFVALTLCGGTGVVAYVLLWVLVPAEDGVVDAGAGSFRAS